jgi:hypothetical protein
MDPPDQLPKNRGLLTLTYRFFLLALKTVEAKANQRDAAFAWDHTRTINPRTPSCRHLVQITPSSQKVQALVTAANRVPPRTHGLSINESSSLRLMA